MRQHSTVASLYHAQTAWLTRTNADIRRGHVAVARRSLSDFSEFTAGPLKERDRRRLGYPYARGSSAQTSTATGFMRGAAPKKLKLLTGRASLPKISGLLIINKDKGDLRAKAYLRETNSSGFSQTFSLGSDSKHAKYVLDPRGTKKMIGRKVFGGKMIGQQTQGLIEMRWKQRNKALLDYIKRKQRT